MESYKRSHILSIINFDHTSLICILPYGVLSKIDCDKIQFTVLESGVI
jgi:hypothetical protein